MTSVETRDAVKEYELRHNAMLQSILPGGLLSSLELKERCEALLVPRQVSLEVTHIAPYFLARAQRRSSTSTGNTAPTLSALFGEEEETTKRGDSDQEETSAPATAATPSGVTFPPENAHAFRAALRRFLEYHLLHFDNVGTSEFTNLSGQRGSFAEDLDHVKRFGYFGQVAVLADADALRPRSSAAGSGGTSAVAADLPCHPSSLQIFIIEKPLMDANEVRFVMDMLRKLTLPAASSLEANKRGASLKTDLAGKSLTMGDPHISFSTPCLKASGEQYNLSTLSTARVAAAMSVDRRDIRSCDESVTETIVIEDFEADPPEDPDLEAYVAKYTHISERQRQHSESSRVKSEAEAPSAGTLSLKGQVIGTPSSSSASAVRGRLVGTVAAAENPHKASGVTGAEAAAATATVRVNVLRHQYSRECIKDYRRVVAADNEIFYGEFERLMSSRCASSLAKTMSEYVSKNQQLNQPILNNDKYNKFVERCHALLRQTARLSANEERLMIMQEGIERYVTSRLYHQIFNVAEDEKRKNELLQQKLLRLENMTPENLEALPEVERHHVWGQAMFELDGMDFFKSPREKLRCGMRACELLSLAVGDILRQRRNAKGSEKVVAPTVSGNNVGVPLAFGADEFLPCFLLLVLRARPLSFVQNVCYIEKFRFPTLMSPEESYCFATLQSALLYWQNCRDDGRIDPNYAAAATPNRAEALSHNGSSVSSRPPTTSSSTLSSLLQRKQPPPRMTEKDLLPSVRHASTTNRQQTRPASSNQAASEGEAVPEGSQIGGEEAPTVLDVLFGWANRNLAPLANEIGRRGKPGGLGGNSSKRGSESRTSEPSPTFATGALAVRSPPRGTVVTSTSIVPQAEVVRDPSFPNGVFHAASAPSSPQSRLEPKMSSRARVRHLLVTQKKTFEQLTLTELQLIVEEARQLLLEEK
ncbi:hypothetical protein LSCM1_00497 [Leishmania martiniquensis]|uniref:VPS9 domain-containing protein n=1 Tax=Leishmania martiniquensis TaxID=1580590 RepID=A0A836KB38_9TRYP|nr:hypothetical protein LSCM1_00497 [Leishmania martiniquensis]